MWRWAERVAVPGFDALALGVGLVAWPGWTFAGAAYAAAVFLLLLIDSSAQPRISPHLADDLGALGGRFALPLVVLGPILARRPDNALLIAPPATLALLLAGRLAAYAVLRQLRARGLVVDRTLVVGAGEQGLVMVETMWAHPEYGLQPVGLLDDVAEADLPLPVIGPSTALADVIKQLQIRRVIIAFGVAREPTMVAVLRSCQAERVAVHVMPRFFELGVGTRSTDDVWGIPLLRLKRSALGSSSWHLKRAFDLVVASVAMVVLAPLFVLFGALVKLSSPGPIILRQKRVGQSGRVFQLLKFRTMLVNDESDTQWSVDDDDRRTRIGRFLRDSGLDELPQLVNVVRGEMSLVGPRPERPHFSDSFGTTVQRYSDRQRVPAGVTGWAQVHGLRGDSSISERARFDNHYIEHWSLWRDVVIMSRTTLAPLRSKLARPRPARVARLAAPPYPVPTVIERMAVASRVSDIDFSPIPGVMDAHGVSDLDGSGKRDAAGDGRDKTMGRPDGVGVPRPGSAVPMATSMDGTDTPH